MDKLTVVDLCCGAGGFSEGFRQAGFEILTGIDIWGDALSSFEINHCCSTIQSDIRNVHELPDCDVVIGSPPCQSFSRLQNGRAEPDTSIIDHVYDLVDGRPYVFENVWQARGSFKDYIVKLPAYRFGVPQIRERLFASSHPFPLFSERFAVMDDVLKGELLTTVANTNANGKRWKKMSEACWTIDTSDSFRLDGRKLTITEYKRLMGFPYSYYFVGTRPKVVKQIGNAVCPPVATAIAEAMISEL